MPKNCSNNLFSVQIGNLVFSDDGMIIVALVLKKKDICLALRKVLYSLLIV